MSAQSGRVHGVVLAGGSGQRFWPISRELSPKQLLSMFGTESLIAQAIHRVAPVLSDGCKDVLVVTNERLVDEIRNHLLAQDDKQLGKVRYLVEPVGRNTAPAIALACAYVVADDPEGVVVVVPSDHVLEAGQAWFDALEAGIALARAGYLVTIGIRPTRADTAYGYIHAGEVMAPFSRGEASAFAADAFVEKPDARTAAAYLADGGYLWNAGVFVMRAAALLDVLAEFPETAPIERAARAIVGSSDDDEARRLFAALSSVSVDVAVMERSEHIAVVSAEVGWSDVGSLSSLGTLSAPDTAGNVRTGRGVDVRSADTIVYAPERLVATLGVRDLVIVDTVDATLVAHKDALGDVRVVVEALRAVGADEVVEPRTSLRPWGTWRTLLETPGYKVKEIDVKPGCRVSLQRHGRRSENWIVVSGCARVTRGDAVVHLSAGESIYLPAGIAHRMENVGEKVLRIIEVQIGDYLGEDDIERLEDDWRRDEDTGNDSCGHGAGSGRVGPAR